MAWSVTDEKRDIVTKKVRKIFRFSIKFIIFADEKCDIVTKKVCKHGHKERKISKTDYRKEERRND